MAVDTTRFIDATNFVRFSGQKGPLVGTFEFDHEATGDAGGGTVRVASAWTGNEWGFRALLVPKALSVTMTADPGNVETLFTAAGNRRLRSSVIFGYDLVATRAGGLFTSPEYVLPEVLIERESDGLAAADFLAVIFDVNDNMETYHSHGYGLVYDTELLARFGAYHLVHS